MWRFRFSLLVALGFLAAGLLGIFVSGGKAADAAPPFSPASVPRLSAGVYSAHLLDSGGTTQSRTAPLPAPLGCVSCTSSLPAWQTVAPVPNPPVAAPAVASDGTYVYAFGGYSYQLGAPTNRVARFQPPNGAWEVLASMADAHSESLAVYSPSNNKIYVFGGVDSVGTVLAATRVYDISTNTWSTTAPMPGPRRQMGGGALGNIIYVAGGYSGSAVSSVLSTVTTFNLGTNTWAMVTPLPQPVGGPGYGMISGKLYIAGGRDSTTPNLDTLYVYNVPTNTWQSLSTLCQGVNAPGSAVINGQLWLFGGGNPLLSAQPPGSPSVPATTNILQVYDPPTDTWTTPNTPLNVARSLIGGTNVGNTAVAVGGYDGTTSVDTTEVNSGGTGSICALAATRTPFPPNGPTKTPTPTRTGTPPTPIPTPVNCYTYGVTVGTGTIVPATTLLAGSNCDDCVVVLDMSALKFQFPFYDLYSPAFDVAGNPVAPSGPPIMDEVIIDSNGKTHLTGGATTTPSPTSTTVPRDGDKGKAPNVNVCLPAPSASYTIFPHFDDLRTDCTGCGIFTAITGTVGSRIFDIEWRGEYYVCGGRVDIELRLYETTGDFEIIYGQVDQAGSHTTIGVQRDPGAFTQYACNMPGSLTPGLMLHFTRQSCSAPTITPTATVTSTPPTATPTRTPVVECPPLPTATLPAATATPCRITFTDVPTTNTFYANIRCLSCRGIMGGYSDGTFRPNNNITRGQLSKIVANSAGFNEPVSGQTFEDVPTDNTFYDVIERMASRGIIGGYPCGGTGEPCGSGDRPYFRPNANATRGQISKIVSEAAGYDDPPQRQTFQDVPTGSTFHVWIERLASRSIMGGYPCGGEGEPCIPPDDRPYFRPNNNATRGQTSKIVANTFFPGCSTPSLAKR